MKQHLTDEQERVRLEGLRILARMIARHALANPDFYQDRSAAERQPPIDGNCRDGDGAEHAVLDPQGT